MESVKDDILEIIEKYRLLPADYIDIEALIFIRKQLSTLGTTLAVELGKRRRVWKVSTKDYEIKKVQKQIVFYKKQNNLEKAKMYAKANTEEFYEAAVKSENEFYDIEYIFRQLKEVQGELNQSISYLREELKQTRFFSKETEVKVRFISIEGFRFVEGDRSFIEVNIRGGDPINNLKGRAIFTKSGGTLQIKAGLDMEDLDEIGLLFNTKDQERLKEALLELGENVRT